MDASSATYPAPVYDPATGAAISSNSPGVVYPATSTGTTTSSSLNPSAHPTHSDARATANDARATASDVRATASQKAQNAQEKAASAAETAKVKAANAAQTAKVQASGVAQQVANHPVVQNATATVQAQVSALDKELSRHQFARDFEAKTHVPKAYTFLGLIGTLFVTIFFNTFGFAPAVTNLLGYALPAYFSIQALESSGSTDDKQWLTYWISFSSFTLIESIFGNAIQKAIPWWFVIKTVLIVYLQLPGTRGAAQLYDNVLRPLLARGRKAKVDGTFNPSTYSAHSSTTPATSTAYSPNSTTVNSSQYANVAPVTSNDRVL